MKNISCVAGTRVLSLRIGFAHVLAAGVVVCALRQYHVVLGNKASVLVDVVRYKLQAQFFALAGNVGRGRGTASASILMNCVAVRCTVYLHAVVTTVAVTIETKMGKSEVDAVPRRSHDFIDAPLIARVELRVLRTCDVSLCCREYASTWFLPIVGGETRFLC